ncbi:MAG TPA: flagellar basal-body MS-ring/collar protein FliF, partial [Solirubrobacteraceae bacterium]|nr:flagellar basal-body MS-ring/collar protein FliF [Solirubrobacteraceae bacterium]
VGAGALVGVLFIYLLMSMASSPSYTTLVAGQTPAQTEKITTALSAGAIAYELTNNGTGIEVNPSDVGKARDLLDGQGLLSGTAGTLSSYLGSTSLGESQFQQQEQTTSALEQQLDQTIEGMNGINQAEVQLAVPNQADNLFTGTNTQPTASVLLNTDNTLGGTTVKSIAGIVAGDVTGLSQSKITITDQNGDVLWPTSANSNLGNSLTAKQSAENAYDQQMADKVDAMLAATLGPGIAVANVNADLDANQQNLASVVYSKQKTPNTTAVTQESLKGTGTTPSGTAGNSATNLSYAATSGGNSNYTNKTNTTSFNDGRTISHTTVAPGAINRQSISVLINSKKVPASDLPTIRSTVEAAVGYNKKRGDSFTIGSLPFAKIAAPAATSSSTTSSMTGKIKYIVLGLGAFLFLFFMRRTLRKRESEQFAGQPTWLRELEQPRSLAEIEAQTQMVDLEGPSVVARLRPPVNVAKQQVEELVDRDPERVASQIRQWMTED